MNTEITPKEWVIQLFWRRLLLTWNRSKNAVNKSNYREVNHVFISVIKERFRFTFTPWPVCLLLLFIITRQRSKDSNQFYPFLWAVFNLLISYSYQCKFLNSYFTSAVCRVSLMTGSIKKLAQSRLHITSPHVQGNPDSGMREIFVCGIRITLVLESGIQLKESGI